MKSKISHDKTLANCCCEQAQVNVLLIGRTQNGKSCLVKSILSYGGYDNISKKVKRGNNNVSQTQIVSAYARKIELKTRQLKDKDGKSITFSSKQVQQLQKAGMKHYAVPSGRHVHLKLIDSPGLGDSNNYKAAAATFKHKSITELSTLKVVDEQHKLEIMQRLLAEGTIHGVCFVIKWDELFSNSIQEDIKAYLDIFEESKLTAMNYHVLHTAVLPASRSPESLNSRIMDFQAAIDLPARHHFLDSDPDPEIPLEVYLSQLEINKLLDSLASNKPCLVPDLKYTKSAPQQSLDADLRNLIMGQDGISKIVGTELDDLKKDARKANAQAISISQQLNRSRMRKHIKEEEIGKLDTDDLVDILEKPVKRGTSWKWFGSSTIVFDIPTPTIIRDAKKYPDDENWSDISKLGTCHFHAKYTGNLAAVTLKGYKRDHFAVELR